jgi:hypothetical protein
MFQHMSDMLMGSLGNFMRLFHGLNRPCIIEMVPSSDAIAQDSATAAYGRQVAAHAHPFLEALDERILALEADCAYPSLVRTMLLSAWEGLSIELSHLLLPDVLADTDVTRPQRGGVRKASTKRVRGGFLNMSSKQQVAYMSQQQVRFAAALHSYIAQWLGSMEFDISQEDLDSNSAGMCKMLPLLDEEVDLDTVVMLAENCMATAHALLAANHLKVNAGQVRFPRDSNLHGTSPHHYVSALQWHEQVLGRRDAHDVALRLTTALAK